MNQPRAPIEDSKDLPRVKMREFVQCFDRQGSPNVLGAFLPQKIAKARVVLEEPVSQSCVVAP